MAMQRSREAERYNKQFAEDEISASTTEFAGNLYSAAPQDFRQFWFWGYGQKAIRSKQVPNEVITDSRAEMREKDEYTIIMDSGICARP